jgi:hypothetical protein
MQSVNKKNSRSNRNKYRLAILVLCVFTAIFIITEVTIRWFGLKPMNKSPFEFSVSPMPYSKKDSTYGYVFMPGRFNIAYANGFSFSATHDMRGYRVVDATVSDTLPTLGLFGCSFAYGQGVEDTQTMAYFLQRKTKTYKVKNYAVGGYGTVQQCLRLKQLLNDSILPKAVIFTYASFHHERNAGSRKYIKLVAWGSGGKAANVELPCWNNKNELYYSSVNYPLLGACGQSALINTVDDLVNSTLLNEDEIFSITCASILRAAESCKEKSIYFSVFGLSNDNYNERMKAFCQQKNIAFSSLLPDTVNRQLDYLPDGHPSEHGHRLYAEAIANSLPNF